jgi:hypothetical protein
MTKKVKVIFSDKGLADVLEQISQWVYELDDSIEVVSITNWHEDNKWSFEIEFQYK